LGQCMANTSIAQNPAARDALVTQSADVFGLWMNAGWGCAV